MIQNGKVYKLGLSSKSPTPRDNSHPYFLRGLWERLCLLWTSAYYGSHWVTIRSSPSPVFPRILGDQGPGSAGLSDGGTWQDRKGSSPLPLPVGHGQPVQQLL
jgi:hypothetical protein